MSSYDPILANQPLLAEIEAFIARTGTTATSFGRDALNDPALVPNLRSGRQVTMRTLHRIREFMAERSESAA